MHYPVCLASNDHTCSNIYNSGSLHLHSTHASPCRRGVSCIPVCYAMICLLNLIVLFPFFKAGGVTDNGHATVEFALLLT